MKAQIDTIGGDMWGNTELNKFLLAKNFTYKKGGFDENPEKVSIKTTREALESTPTSVEELLESTPNEAYSTFAYSYTPDRFTNERFEIFYSELASHITVKDKGEIVYEGTYTNDTLLLIKELVRNDSLDNLLD